MTNYSIFQAHDVQHPSPGSTNTKLRWLGYMNPTKLHSLEWTQFLFGPIFHSPLVDVRNENDMCFTLSLFAIWNLLDHLENCKHQIF